jgi:hypothetical protein
MGDVFSQSLSAKAVSDVQSILDLVVRGEVVGIAATLIYEDGGVLYVPIGCAPDPLDGLASWVRTRSVK